MVKRIRFFLGFAVLFILLAGNPNALRLVTARENNATSVVPNTLYAASNTSLYEVYPYVPETVYIDPISITPITDIAFDGQVLYGVTYTNLVTINPSDGSATNIGSMGFSDVNGLALVPVGSLYGSTLGGALIAINRANGSASLVGYFGAGLGSYGDIAFRDDGVLFAALSRTGYANSWLATINVNNGSATLLGDMGYPDVWGLSFLDGTLYGATSSGNIITVNQGNGSTSLVFYDGWVSYWGLTTSPGSIVPPAVNWIKPVGNTQVYTASGGIVDLEVSVTPGSFPVNHVEFWRWDAVNLELVFLGADTTPPYQSTVDVDTLNIEWNEIDAYAYDSSGYAGGAYIWIYRTVPPPIAHFDAWPIAGDTPLDVEMHSYSEGVIDTCLWDYGDGLTGNSCEGYHWHTYTNPGLYSPSLTVSGPGGSDTQTIVDYINVTSPQPNTYSIGGWVEDANANPISGVTISDDQGHSTTTDQFGDFIFTGLSEGVYTLTPSKAGYTFDPPGVAVSVPPDVWDISFVGTQDVSTYTISGWVLGSNSEAIPGVKVSSEAGSTVTNTAGWYTMPGLPAGNYKLTPSKEGYTFDPPAQTVSVPPSKDSVIFRVKSIKMPLLPNPDGYKFKNGAFTYKSLDFTRSDMVKLLGDRKEVCMYISNGECVLGEPADVWFKKVAERVKGGYCMGMASTSLRFFTKLNFPWEFQPYAQTTYDLNIDNSRRFITKFQILQWGPVTYKALHIARTTQTMQGIINLLENSFKQGIPNDPYTLVIYDDGLIFGIFGGGHALVPYELEYASPGVWNIWVYDPNYPGEYDHKVTVQNNAGVWSWKYADMGPVTWEGTETIPDKNSIYLLKLSEMQEDQSCVFCVDPIPTNMELALSATKGGHMLIKDGNGKYIGYQNGEFVDQLDDAYAVAAIGNIIPSEPLYILPLRPLTMEIDGAQASENEDISVVQFGPGYAIGMERTLTPSTHDKFGPYTDGTAIVYVPNANSTVAFNMADDRRVEGSYEFNVSDITILQGREFFLSNILGNGQLWVNNNHNAVSGTYDFSMERVSVENGIQTFSHANIPISPTDSHLISYGWWEGGTIQVQVDYGSDWTIDETWELSNESYVSLKRIFLPIVIKKR